MSTKSKSLNASDDTVICCVRLPKKIDAKLKARALAEERSKSWVIVRALRALVADQAAK